LIQAEVKERCNTLVGTAFSAIPSTDIVKIVQKQLLNYNYTLPKAPNVSFLPNFFLANLLPEECSFKCAAILQ